MAVVHRPLSYKLRPDELAALREAATAAGIGTSTYAAEAVRRAIGTTRRRPMPRQQTELTVALREATVAVSRVGGLANQLCRHAHTGGRVDADALDRLRAQLALIDARLEASAR
ncbi:MULTISPECIES: hypothetical protein [Hyphomicrobiales]|jgi:hypothetical protein|uniref:Mobilization protein n=1 Tax=Bosea massiliensis TaxID=151419 RepID=A0ABW0PA59_9HYPH|nr:MULTISPECIES: hypothetical protein [Hyphomicrobiales]